MKQNKNKLWIKEARLHRADSRAGHFAAWIIRPVAVEADHTPFDAPCCADNAGVLAYPVVDGVPPAIADQRRRAAKAARDGPLGPGTGRRLAHPIEADDLERRIPEFALLLGEARGDRLERGRTGRQVSVIARPA